MTVQLRAAVLQKAKLYTLFVVQVNRTTEKTMGMMAVFVYTKTTGPFPSTVCCLILTGHV